MPPIFHSQFELVDVSSRDLLDEEVAQQGEHMVCNVRFVHPYARRLLVLARKLPQIPFAEIRYPKPFNQARSNSVVVSRTWEDNYRVKSSSLELTNSES
jgi:hypothetical protein